MTNADSENRHDSEESKRFEELMRRWDIKLPTGFPPTARGFLGESHLQIPMCLEELLAKWCYERFATPFDAVEALRQGNNIGEASASLFWYCYSLLQGFSGEIRWLFREVAEHGVDKGQVLVDRIEVIMSQLNKMREKVFTVNDIKYPLTKQVKWGKPYVEVIVSAALIILRSREQKWHHDVRKLITDTYEVIGDIPIGESGHEVQIGITDLQMERVGDYEYILTGDIFYFLTMIACIVVWDSYANISSKQGKYKDALAAHIKALDYYLRTLIGEWCGEVVWAEDELSFLRLPYSESNLADAEMVKRIINTWEQAKESLRTDEDWQEAACLLDRLRELSSYVLYKCTEEDVSKVFELKDIDELEDYLHKEVIYCCCQAKVLKHLHHSTEWPQKKMRREILRRYFFSGELLRQFEKGTYNLLENAEADWYDKKFLSMAEHIRKALECEIIATLPFLRSKIEQADDECLPITRIKRAIRGDEAVRNQIDLLPIEKSSKTWLKKAVPGFIEKLLEVRHFYKENCPSGTTARDKIREMKNMAETVHREFFGINCEGVLPRLMKLKTAIRAREK